MLLLKIINITNYREQLEKIQKRERLEKDVDWLKTIPVID